MATQALTKEDVTTLVQMIERCIKADKMTQTRTSSPLMKEAITAQNVLYEKLKQKLLGV